MGIDKIAVLYIMTFHQHAANTIVMFVVFIERYFIIHPQPDQHSHGHTNSKTPDIDECGNLVLGEVTKTCFEIIFKHSYSLRSDLIGFASAALIAWKLTVTSAIITE